MLAEGLAPILRVAVGQWVFFNGAFHPMSCFQSFVADAESTDASKLAKCKGVVYEVLRYRNGRACWADRHASRIAESMRSFGFFGSKGKDGGDKDGDAKEAPEVAAVLRHWKQQFADVVKAVAERNAVQEQNVKIVVWRQTPAAAMSAEHTDAPNKMLPTGLFTPPHLEAMTLDPLEFHCCVYTVPSFYPPHAWYEHGGTSVAVMTAQRDDPHAKVPLPEMRGRAEAMQKKYGVFETLLKRPSDGVITEGSRSNFFLVMRAPNAAETSSDDERTPATTAFEIVESLDSDVLLGITRTTIDRICDIESIKLTKRQITEADLRNPRTVAMSLSGTSLGALPVTKILFCTEDDHCERCPTRDFFTIHPVLAKLQRLYAEYRDGDKTFPEDSK